MNIDKAIRKQKKSYKRFLLAMCFIFFTLPIALVISKKFYVFYIIYLVIVEFLILLVMFISLNNETLRFNYDGYRLKILLGLGEKKVNIIPDKVVLVHIENVKLKNNKVVDFKIILISESKFRSNRMIALNLDFFKKYPYIAYHYNRIMNFHPSDNYYYTIIKRGGICKYPLLDTIYKTCVYAYFTEETVEKIKNYRKNSEYYD